MDKKKIFKYIEKIQETLEKIENFQRKHTDEKILVAFRGEPRDYKKTKLMPSIFRSSETLNKESYLFELMSDYGMLEFDKNRSIDKAIESQHYLAISRMLDITFSILPALYFACSNEEDMSEDGVLYVFCFPEHYSPHSAYLEDIYNNVMENGENIAYAKNFKVITHSYSNERIRAQSGGFIFFPGNDYVPIDSIYYEGIRICANDKREICLELKKLFNVSKATLFPEENVRAQMIRKILKDENYTKREFSVANEIDACFDRIIFEVEVYRQKDRFDEVELQRRLRKEKDDLISYIKFLEIDMNSKNEYIEKINTKFEVLGKIY